MAAPEAVTHQARSRAKKGSCRSRKSGSDGWPGQARP